VLSLDIHIFLCICLDDIRPDLPTQKTIFYYVFAFKFTPRGILASLAMQPRGSQARVDGSAPRTIFFFSRETSACMTIRELLRIQRGRANSCMMHVADYVIGSTRASCTFFLRGYLSFGYRCVFTNVITHPTWTRYPLDLDVR
jgi:hypothetical protein